MSQERVSRRQALGAVAGVGAVAAVGDAADKSRRPYRAEPVVGAMSKAARRERRPNVLLIVCDQLRHWHDLPAELGLRAHEALLERGLGFSNFHAHTTPCSPARSIMYFGRHTQHTRVTANFGAPPSFPELAEGMPSVGHLLRAQGYYTAYKGKWHLSHMRADPGLVYGPYPGTEAALEPYGFSDYNADGDPHGATWTGYRYDGEIASNAVQWLGTKGRDLSGRQPWFLAVNFVNPHDVMYVSTGPGQEAGRLQRNLMSPLSTPPAGGVYDDVWDVPLPESWRRDDLRDKPWATKAFAEMCDWVYGPIDRRDEAAWRAYQSYYFNCVRDVDSHVLTVLQALQRLGLDDETVVIFTADHGEMAGAHGLRQKGPLIYKENVRLPFIVRHPDAKGGGQTTALGGHVDLVPTLLGLAGVTPEAAREAYPWLKGVDLAPALASPDGRSARDDKGILFNYGVSLYLDPAFTRAGVKTGRRLDRLTPLFVGFQTGQFLPSLGNPALFRGVHDGRYKFARYFRPADHHTPQSWEDLVGRNQLELYDTLEDPDEITNLAAAPERHKELLMRLNARTNRLLAEEVGPDLGAEFPGPTFLYHRGDA
ncbi:sulfatase-like hydrolase/transferase [Caulobacter sp. 17J65-9]|uniref:sulfatase-like hydrolase/transferase n=1 Tax=Caulobacter sp. 17J65-9 TaxID=2709382 RepID=UPI0013C7CFDE|nr:sulfatase-like hydrolase/transferase [Caulobacter sp. 17J65-9]NEX92232.1 sulfatase-like hydrolase/transferase [Caulobacter sp. 17J65-9]